MDDATTLEPGPEPAPERESEPAAEPAVAAAEKESTAHAAGSGGESESSEPSVQARLAPFLGSWFEDKSHGDVSSLGTFLTACAWGWATRPLLTNAPNQMWIVQQHEDDGQAEMRIGVELNALMQRLVQLVGAAPFVRYDCSGAPFEFELFTGVTGRATVSWEAGALHLHKVITAPEYVMECHWVYSVVQPATAPGQPVQYAKCKADYVPSHDTAMAMSAGETGRVVGEVSEEWTKICVTRGDKELVGHVPTSFLDVSTAEEGVPPVADQGAAASADASFGEREEMWCRQTNKVFKRRAAADGDEAAAAAEGEVTAAGATAAAASLKGEAVPDMDHTMHQVWIRAQDGDGGVLGMLMR